MFHNVIISFEPGKLQSTRGGTIHDTTIRYDTIFYDTLYRIVSCIVEKISSLRYYDTYRKYRKYRIVRVS